MTQAHRLELVYAIGRADGDLEHLVTADEGCQPRERLLACMSGSGGLAGSVIMATTARASQQVANHMVSHLHDA